MNEYIEACLVDVLQACTEVESFFQDGQRNYFEFCNNTMLIRAVERNVEIMGEALNRIRKYDTSYTVPDAKAIIETRNRVIHGYDSVTPEFLWSLVIKHIPVLKNNIESILSSH